jgi:hypothetical protein
MTKRSNQADSAAQIAQAIAVARRRRSLAHESVADVTSKITSANEDRERAVAAIAAIEANKPSPNDGSAIKAYVVDRGVATMQLELLDEALVSLRTALAESQSEAALAAEDVDREEARQLRQAMIAKWAEVWPRHAPALFELIRDAAAVDALCIATNQRRSPGKPLLVPVFGLAEADVVANIQVVARNALGGIIFTADERVNPAAPDEGDGDSIL